MTKKSAATMKPKATNAVNPSNPQELLNSWRDVELIKISSMQTQLKRPDTYISLYHQLKEFAADAHKSNNLVFLFDEVQETVNKLLETFNDIKVLIEEVTVEMLLAENKEDFDPFKSFFRLIDDASSWDWIEIAEENVVFETVRPYAEHYFNMRDQVVKAWKTLNESDEQ